MELRFSNFFEAVVSKYDDMHDSIIILTIHSPTVLDSFVCIFHLENTPIRWKLRGWEIVLNVIITTFLKNVKMYSHQAFVNLEEWNLNSVVLSY